MSNSKSPTKRTADGGKPIRRQASHTGSGAGLGGASSRVTTASNRRPSRVSTLSTLLRLFRVTSPRRSPRDSIQARNGTIPSTGAAVAAAAASCRSRIASARIRSRGLISAIRSRMKPWVVPKISCLIATKSSRCSTTTPSMSNRTPPTGVWALVSCMPITASGQEMADARIPGVEAEPQQQDGTGGEQPAIRPVRKEATPQGQGYAHRAVPGEDRKNVPDIERHETDEAQPQRQGNVAQADGGRSEEPVRIGKGREDAGQDRVLTSPGYCRRPEGEALHAPEHPPGHPEQNCAAHQGDRPDDGAQHQELPEAQNHADNQKNLEDAVAQDDQWARQGAADPYPARDPSDRDRKERAEVRVPARTQKSGPETRGRLANRHRQHRSGHHGPGQADDE